MKLTQLLWSNCQSECLKSRQELFRILPFCSKVSGVEEILKELKNIKGEGSDTFFEEMMVSQNFDGPHNLYISSCIDINLENKLRYIINEVTSRDAPRYMQWIVNNCNVSYFMLTFTV